MGLVQARPGGCSRRRKVSSTLRRYSSRSVKSSSRTPRRPASLMKSEVPSGSLLIRDVEVQAVACTDRVDQGFQLMWRGRAHKPKIIARPARPGPASHVPDTGPSRRRPEDTSAQVAQVFGTHNRILVSQHQEFGIFGHPTLGQHHQTTQQTAHKQINGREDRSGMIPVPARPSKPHSVIEPTGCLRPLR
jgi:hypothetical protein